MDTRLNGLYALVCGGTQGIGKATAIELARCGAHVVLLARDAEKLGRTVEELARTEGQLHRTVACDMSDMEALTRAVNKLAEEVPVSIVVNNTGGPSPGPAHLADIAQYTAAFSQHLLAFQTILAGVVPGMKERRMGRIVNVISTSVKQPLPNLGVSNTIRGAVANWGKTLANELGPFNITVNNVLPGATETERLSSIIANKAQRSGTDPEEAKAEMLAEVPLRRFAKPEEIAAAIAFLVGPSGAYINGINLPVDGGRTACL